VIVLAELKADQARIWGSASWQQIAERQLFPVHDGLIARLGPRPGERWLDLASGTGAVALRAARAGARVTGQDPAPELIETARLLAAKEGLSVAFDVGDAENLGYPTRRSTSSRRLTGSSMLTIIALWQTSWLASVALTADICATPSRDGKSAHRRRV
jgi:SAM-dependent methyltransferase